MGNCSRKHQGIFCFSASSLDDEANAYRGKINPESPRYLRSRHHRRVVAKVLGSTSVSAFLKRSKSRRKDSSQPSSHKGSDTTDDDDRKTASILSTAGSSNSSFFSIASSPSFRSTPDATEQKPQRKQAPLPGGPEPRKTPSGPVTTSDSGIGIFLLVVSLVVIVFWGRFLAILWTSSWLFFIACWCYARGTAAATVIKQADECTLTTELRRRWMEEAEEKKRVVRRGLLERSRRI